MKEKFFEGKDFSNGEFKALMPQYYPLKYKRYIKEETELLKRKLAGANRILEAGVGIGRLIPILAPKVKEFVGIDNASLMLKKAREVANKFENVRIVSGNVEDLSTLFPPKYFDFSLCMWNTLGNVRNEVEVLKELAKVTKKCIFLTVYRKGTLKDREDWYRKVGVKISRIDKKEEIFYSESGLKSKSYNVKDIEKITKAAHLNIKESKILGGVMLWVELTTE